MPWESLQESAEKVESRRRSTCNRFWRFEDQMYWSGDYLCRQRWKSLFHLGANYTENLEVYRHINFEEFHNLFDITQRLILDHQAEILNVSPIDWTAPSSTRSTLSHDQVITWTKAKVHVYSDSVLCLEDAGAFRSKSKMEESTWRISTVRFLQRIIWNRWRTEWVRVDDFPRTYFTGDPLEDPKRPVRSKHWRKISNFTKVCEDATFSRRASLGMSNKTIPDEDDGFGDRTQSRREYTVPRANSDSRIYATIPGQTFIGLVLQVHVIHYLGINGIEFQIPSTTTQERTSWVVICRGKNRYVENLHLNDPDHNPTSSDLLLERSATKEREPGSAEMEPSTSIEETHAKQFEIQTTPVYNYSEEVIPIEERKWNDIPAYKHFRVNTFEAEVSKLPMRWDVIMIKTKEKQTALFMEILWVQNCGKQFEKPEGKNSRTEIGFDTLMKEATNEDPVLRECQ